ncbi:hypothetical protein [Sphingomonas sp. R86521]|uniref:hypothetical protein n=1 Tax=Sphingomonas sp. R86521 TaxID=3093860 RepID=UPI0036D23E09
MLHNRVYDASDAPVRIAGQWPQARYLNLLRTAADAPPAPTVDHVGEFTKPGLV